MSERDTSGAPDAARRPAGGFAEARSASSGGRPPHTSPEGHSPGGRPPGPPDEPDRLLSGLADADDRVIESTLRPKRLADFVGQGRVREQLSLVLEGALRRGRAPDHVLLSGPPGIGKTTMAMIIAAELGAPLR
ncbi:MAG: AAA family ATPase, partial [Nocardiopsaceae bacterium]|nr:AAA family ATPase [Nocardiopsaceae bacterium]